MLQKWETKRTAGSEDGDEDNWDGRPEGLKREGTRSKKQRRC